MALIEGVTKDPVTTAPSDGGDQAKLSIVPLSSEAAVQPAAIGPETAKTLGDASVQESKDRAAAHQLVREGFKIHLAELDLKRHTEIFPAEHKRLVQAITIASNLDQTRALLFDYQIALIGCLGKADGRISAIRPLIQMVERAIEGKDVSNDILPDETMKICDTEELARLVMLRIGEITTKDPSGDIALQRV